MSRPLRSSLHSDANRILLAMVAVAIVVTAAFVSASADSSDAADTDCKTYYYNQLSEYGKLIYDAVPTASFGIDSETGDVIATTKIDLSAYAGETATDVATHFDNGMSEALACFAMEKVGCYWVGGQWKISTTYSYNSEGKLTSGTVTVKVLGVVTEYGATDDQVATTMTSVQTALNNVTVDDTSRYSKVETIHEQVCRILDYDDDKPAGAGCRNIATGLIGTHSVVCEGYAKLFKALCDLHDVPCLIVTGDAGTTEKEGHMWNYVQMDDGKWYLVDCTWDDQDYDGTNPSNLYTTYLLAGSDTVGFKSTKVCDSHIPTSKPIEDAPIEFTLETLNTDRYTSEKFTVKFSDIDGTVCASKEYSMNDIVDLDVENPSYSDDKVGTYTFKEWNTETDGTGASYVKDTTKVTGPLTFHAVYDIAYKNYYYTFDLDNGSSPETKTYTYGASIVIPTGFVKAPADNCTYVFKGWADNDGDPVTPDSTAVKTPTVYKALYTASYSLTGYSDSYLLSSADLAKAKTTDKLTITLCPEDKVLAKFTFDKTALDALSSDTIKVTMVPFSDLSPTAQSKLTSATVYRIDFGSNNDAFTAGHATVSLAYQKSVSDSIGGIKLFYVDGDDIQGLNFTYGDGMVVFETNHFSDYAVKGFDLTSDLTWYYPIFIILILAFIGMAIAYKFS